MVPAYDPGFFRVAEPKEPLFHGNDIEHIVAFNQKMTYDLPEILARIFDNNEYMEFKPDYGLEVYTGLVRMDGLLVGFLGNCRGFLGSDYSEYSSYYAIGGKLFR